MQNPRTRDSEGDLVGYALRRDSLRLLERAEAGLPAVALLQGERPAFAKATAGSLRLHS